MNGDYELGLLGGALLLGIAYSLVWQGYYAQGLMTSLGAATSVVTYYLIVNVRSERSRIRNVLRV